MEGAQPHPKGQKQLITGLEDGRVAVGGATGQ